MKEDFLLYVWKHQLFEKKELKLTSGKNLEILSIGNLNHYEGPDFTNARILIDNIEWYGDIEIHILASDWKNHTHHKDKRYNKTILHVVWKNNENVFRQDNSLLPVLTLEEKVPIKYLLNYQKLDTSQTVLSCAWAYPQVSEHAKQEMKRRVVIERMLRKSKEVEEIYRNSENHWETTAYQVIASGFGSKRNKDCFFQLAQNLPLKIIQKHADHSLQTQALIFGVSGFLSKPQANDNYFDQLQKEFAYLQHKYASYHLSALAIQWSFYGVHLPSFPTIRLAFLSQFLSKNQHFFSTMMNFDIQEIKTILASLQLPDYWQKHYHFGKASTKPIKKLSKASINHFLINCIAPLWYCYGRVTQLSTFCNKAFLLWESLSAEANHITKCYSKLHDKPKNAMESQALIELYTNYCKSKKCFECSVGSEIIQA